MAKAVVTSPIDVTSAEIIIKDLTEAPHFTVFDVKSTNVVEAIRLKKNSSTSYWGCLIAATMKEHGITTIYTEDGEFRKIEGIKVIDPFSRLR